MIRLKSRSQIVHAVRRSLWLTLTVCAYLMLVPDNASAQFAPNQTDGFGNERLVTFTSLRVLTVLISPY